MGGASEEPPGAAVMLSTRRPLALWVFTSCMNECQDAFNRLAISEVPSHHHNVFNRYRKMERKEKKVHS